MTKRSDIPALLTEIKEEVESERVGAMTPDEKKLHAIAQKLLLLERDLKAPGAARSADERVDRLLDAIAKEKF